jgi:hypothetical protein
LEALSAEHMAMKALRLGIAKLCSAPSEEELKMDFCYENDGNFISGYVSPALKYFKESRSTLIICIATAPSMYHHAITHLADLLYHSISSLLTTSIEIPQTELYNTADKINFGDIEKEAIYLCQVKIKAYIKRHNIHD